MVEDHTGNGIGKQLEHVLNEWGIKKIMYITVDNVSANDAAVDWIKSFGTKNLLGAEMMKKYNSYFGNAKKLNKLIFVAFVLDPRSKMDILKRGLIKAFQGHPEVAEELVHGTKKLLQDLYECYSEAQPSHVPQAQASRIPSSSSTSTSTSSSTRKVSKSKKLWEQVCDESELDTPTERSELERYFAEDREVPREDFDLLHYWKVMQGRFPTLASIARDVFAIPASTVASESALSIDGRVITDRRSSLLPRIVEALICTQSWMKNILVIGGDEVILEDDVAEEVERVVEEELDVGVRVETVRCSQQHESL